MVNFFSTTAIKARGMILSNFDFAKNGGTPRYRVTPNHASVHPCNNLIVKKFLTLLLLFWMPMQASLAAVEELHSHHNHSPASIAHEHSNSAAYSDPASPLALIDANEIDCASNCSTSQFCNAQLLFVGTVLSNQVLASSVATFADTDSATTDRVSERPERPQWIASSH